MKKTYRTKAPEYLADFLFVTTSCLQQHGIAEEKAIELANAMCERMCESWGKQNIYFPEYDSQERLVRNAQMFREFNGTNILQLSRKYDLSEQAVYAIIKSVLEEHRAKLQPSLFTE